MKVRHSSVYFFTELAADNSTVSMVDGDLFDKLARIGSILRKKTEPFGEIQVRVLSTSTRLF